MEIDHNLALVYLLGGLFSLLSLANLVVSIWDRTRTKPNFVERLNAFERETAKALERKLDKDSLRDALTPFSSRMDGMHQSIKHTNATNEALFRDILRSLGSLEEAVRRDKRE